MRKRGSRIILFLLLLAVISCTLSIAVLNEESKFWVRKKINQKYPEEIFLVKELLDYRDLRLLEEEVSRLKDNQVEGVDQAPQGSITREGAMQPEYQPASGKVFLYQSGENYVLRLEDFELTNGPNLVYYLSFDKQKHQSIEVAPVSATYGETNLLLPGSLEIDNYDYLLVVSKQYNIIFASATLEKVSYPTRTVIQ